MMGNSLLVKWNELHKNTKIALIGTFMIGLLAHAFMMANKFPNHDYPYNVHGDQFRWPLMLGRWFLEPSTVVSSHFFLPWVNGLLCILYVSLAAALIVSVLHIRNTLPVLLCGGLLITYPSFADSLGFLFTADGYMMAMAFAALTAWFWEKKKGAYSCVMSALFLGLAAGIYQAYLSFAIYLVLIRIILDIVEARYTDKELLIKIGRALLFGIAGVGFYYGMQLLVMKAAGVSFADYMGISDAGLLSPGTMASTLFRDTVRFAELFIGSDGSFTAFEVLNGIFILLFLGCYLFIVLKSKLYRRRLQSCLFLAANLCLIPAAYLWDFVSEDVTYRLLMLYCVALLYLLAVKLVDDYMPEWVGNGCLALMTAIILNFILIDNIGYYNLNLCWQESYAMAVQMQDRLQQAEGYEETEDILIIGTLHTKNGNRRDWVLDRIPPMVGVEDVNLMRNQDFIVSILNKDLGMVWEGVRGDQEDRLRASKEVRNMPCWPASGSVKLVDGVMVVKLEDME